MTDKLLAFLEFNFLPYAGFAALGAVFGLCLEAILSDGDKVTGAARVRAALFFALYLVTAPVAAVVAGKVMAALAIKPLFSLDLRWTEAASFPFSLLSWAALPLAGVVTFEFFYYWCHRMQHAIPILWRLHSVHHAAEDFHILTAYHHPSEEFVRIPLLVIPMTFMFHIAAPHAVIATLFALTLGRLQHVNSRLSLGWLRFLIVEPRYHRMHHSADPRHFNSNFANAFPIWDVLFATAYWPSRQEWPKIGLPDRAEAKTLRTFLFPGRLISPPLVRVQSGVEIGRIGR